MLFVTRAIIGGKSAASTMLISIPAILGKGNAVGNSVLRKRS